MPGSLWSRNTNLATLIRASVLVGLSMLSADAAGASTSDSTRTSDTGSDFAASTGVPWNPPHALAPRAAWEQVVLLPGRIASLPFVGIGFVARHSVTFLDGSGWMPGASSTGPLRTHRWFSVGKPGLPDRAGLGASAQLRVLGSDGPMPQFTLRYSASVNLYNRTLVSAARGPLALEYAYDWRPQDRFYGIGTSTSRDDRSDYAAQEEAVRTALRFEWGRDSTRLAPRARVGLWAGPRSLVMRRGRDAAQTSYELRFPELAASTLDRRVEHFVYGAEVGADWRSGRPHWSRGGRVTLAAERDDAPIAALALHTGQSEGASLTKLSFEGEGGISFMRDPRTFRCLLRLVDERTGSDPRGLLFPELSRLGGRDGLAGFGPGRFQDLDLLLTRVTYVFPLARLFEFEVHSEWGAVYHDVWKDASLGSLKSSLGGSMRARGPRSLFGALGLDASREGVRIHYSLGGAE